jgi:manganese/zinc/iron transport system permease protein
MARAATICVLLASVFAAGPAIAVSVAATDSTRSITDRSITWPQWEQVRRVLLLEDYNTRVVILGTTLLGCAAGMVGSFTLLRRRALMGDALSHATLPGIALAFIVATRLGMDGKSLAILLPGATISGLIGISVILSLRSLTRIKEDTALGAVLSVFFGAGVALLGVVQQMKGGHAAGLESFVYGKTASMGIADTQLIAGAAATCIACCLLFFKELKLLCFDDQFAGSRGLPIVRLDMGLMALVVIVTIVGLQAVGLVLMIALLVIPAAAARFWTEELWPMFLISGSLGAASGLAGAATSAILYRLPSGALIVLVCTLLFLLSMIFGSARGVLIRWLRRRRLNRSVDRQHLLRAIFELVEATAATDAAQSTARPAVSIDDLLPKRSWSKARLIREIRRSQRHELVEWVADQIRLTRRGRTEAARLTRQHRLWELYLITHADIAPGRVDRDADAIEHVLEPEVVSELEQLLDSERPAIPQSPHDLAVQGSPQQSSGTGD